LAGRKTEAVDPVPVIPWKGVGNRGGEREERGTGMKGGKEQRRGRSQVGGTDRLQERRIKERGVGRTQGVNGTWGRCGETGDHLDSRVLGS